MRRDRSDVGAARARGRRARAGWWAAGAAMAILALWALPCRIIQLNGAQLRGLVGASGGTGTWDISVSYLGTMSSVITETGYVSYTAPACILSSFNNQIQYNNGTPLSVLDDAGNHSTGGSLSGDVRVYLSSQGVGYPTPGQSGSVEHHVHMSGGTMRFTFTWQPKNAGDPPPGRLKLYYRATASAQGDGGGIVTATATAPGRFASSTGVLVTDPPQPVKDIVPHDLTVQHGAATFDAPIDATIDLVHSGSYPTEFAFGAFAECRVDLGLVQYQIGRGYNAPMSGSNHGKVTDPSFTRWLPLSFSPQINTQPFRTQAGALPAPWGNINCFYSMTLQPEPTPANYDLPGETRLYIPDGYGGWQQLAGDFVPAYTITDATGERLSFDQNLAPYRDIHSTLSGSGTSYTLSNAGPPGSLKEAGHYTYHFSSGRLLSITDDAGNQQYCAWSAIDPYLTVSDLTSGRALAFHAPTPTAYFASVDALGPTGAVNTHTALTMDANGHLTAVKVYDASGLNLLNQSTYTYGGVNGDAIVTQTEGASSSSFAYTTDSNLLDPFGLSNDRLASSTFGLASDTSSSDDGGSVQGTSSATWGPTQEGYNSFGVDAHTNTFTDARGSLFTSLFSLVYDVYGPIKGSTNTGPDFSGAPAGSNITRLVYDPDVVQPSSLTVYDPYYNSGLTQNPWVSNFDAYGNVTSELDPLLQRWQYGYSADGKRLTSVTDPTNLTWTFNFGENGAPASRLTSIADPNGTVRGTVAYNAYGQPLTSTTPAAISASGTNEQVTFGYHATTGDLLSITNPLGDQLQIGAYDALGDPGSATIYPDTGNPATSTQPLTSSLVYDAAQHPVQVNAPDGNSLLTTFTNGVATQFSTVHQQTTLAQMNLSIDSRGRLYSASDSVGLLAQRRYDKNSNATQFWDGKSNITSIAYGSNNEPTGMIWPDGHYASLAYDAGGRLRQAVDERGIVSNYLCYDDGNLKDLQFPAYPAENVHMTYDSAGRLLTITDGAGSRTYNYDATLKHLQSVTIVLSGLPAGHNTFTVSYSYFGDGTLASITTPVGQTSYSYNAAGALTSLTAPSGATTSWTFDHAGRVTRQQSQTGASTITSDYTYGNAAQGVPAVHLNSLVHSVNSQPLWSYSLSRTLLGQVSLQTGTGSQPNQSESESFSYDLRGRLTGDTDHYQTSTTAVSNSANAYTWDLANNLQGGSSGWAYNTSNQATSASASSGAPSLAGGSGLGYDSSGSLTAMNGSALVWNCWGRLASAGGASYTYDSAGRRVSKTVGGVTTYFLYAGSALIAELDSNGSITRSYDWGPLGPISDNSSAGSRFYLFDGVGNTRFLVNAAGQVVGDAAYTAWGAGNSASALATPFAWKGIGAAYTDAETGLVLMGARYYAPALGRFVSRDPSSFAGGPNVYSFCAGDPIDFFDPDGCRQRCVPWEDEGAFWGAIRWTSDFFGDDNPHERVCHVHGQVMVMPGEGPSVFGVLIAAHDAAYRCGTMEGDRCASPAEVIAARINFARTFAAAALQGYCLASCAIPSSPASTGEGVALYGKSRPAFSTNRDIVLGTNDNGNLLNLFKKVIKENLADGGPMPTTAATDVLKDPEGFGRELSEASNIHWDGKGIRLHNGSTLAEWDYIVKHPELWGKVIIHP